ncbi:DUF397 domain-containing protein [Thermomonospora sp. CIF 1]|uniref:DUF397 domain-containing protein n=1 Tax=Thermomonospora sp. CIF 1 TaxID=1916083 RepID=UPI000ABA038E|nr:DUF397 domain-containing protein [Thermomonospora sp. CIF 1]PKK16389.1 MAG: DUF397 domain-containing protein [Thermomonospora sp. CIF 1]
MIETNFSQISWRKSSRSTGNGGNCVEVGLWRKSSHSTGNGGQCVEVGVWRKASTSANNGSCVEVALGGAVVLARDSKDPDGPVLGFSPDEWRSFITSVKAGRHDLH